MGPLSGSLLGGNATFARNPYPTRHFSRQNAVYCPFSNKERVFPDWSSLFGPFLGYFQIRNAIFVDFEERNTTSVDVWVIFGSFSNKGRHDLAKPRASSIYIHIHTLKRIQTIFRRENEFLEFSLRENVPWSRASRMFRLLRRSQRGALESAAPRPAVRFS